MASLNDSVTPGSVSCSIKRPYTPFFHQLQHLLRPERQRVVHKQLINWPSFIKQLIKFVADLSCSLPFQLPPDYESPWTTINHWQVWPPSIVCHIYRQPTPRFLDSQFTWCMWCWRRIYWLTLLTLPHHGLDCFLFGWFIQTFHQIPGSLHTHMVFIVHLLDLLQCSTPHAHLRN